MLASTICLNGELGSHECSHSAAHESHKPTTNTPEHGADLRFTEYAKEISLINLPSYQRRDKKSQITPFELSQHRALNGHLLWLGMQCLPQLLAPLSLLMGQTPQAKVNTIYEVNKLARKATVWARTPLNVHARNIPVVVTYTRRYVAKETAGLHRKRRVVARQRIEHVSDIVALEPSETCGKIVTCSRNSSSSGADEAVQIRLWSERSSVWTARFAKLAIGSETNSCFGGGLSWSTTSWLALRPLLLA